MTSGYLWHFNHLKLFLNHVLDNSVNGFRIFWIAVDVSQRSQRSSKFTKNLSNGKMQVRSEEQKVTHCTKQGEGKPRRG